jgi:PAS domain S-box-containing protein
MNLNDYFIKNFELGNFLGMAILDHGITFNARPSREVESYGAIAVLFYSKFALLSQDHNGRLNFYNPAAQKIFGYTPEEAIGMKSIDLVPENLRGERAEEFSKVLEKRIAVTVDTLRLSKSGELVKVKATVFPYQLGSKLSIAAMIKKSRK